MESWTINRYEWFFRSGPCKTPGCQVPPSHQATSKNMPLSVHFGLMRIANLSGVSTEGWSAKGYWMLLALLTHVSRGLHFAFFGVKAWQACHCRTQNAKVLSLSSLHSHCRQDFWLVTMFQIVQHKVKSLECCLGKRLTHYTSIDPR